MSDKLKELTDRLYNEGLEKGKAEGERILNEAKAEAERIISGAQAEALSIKQKAEADAEDIKSKTASDIKAGSQQCIQAVKKDIENLLVDSLSECKDLEDPEFTKKIIESVVASFSASETKDIELTMPEKLKDELEPWINGELKKRFGDGISAGFSKKISGGFTIGPRNGSYYISLTEETFRELIASYIRPVTRKTVFGE